MPKVTPAQVRWLRFLLRHGRAELGGSRDFDMAGRLAEKGLVSITETRPGFFVMLLTPAGRELIEPPTKGGWVETPAREMLCRTGAGEWLPYNESTGDQWAPTREDIEFAIAFATEAARKGR